MRHRKMWLVVVPAAVFVLALAMGLAFTEFTAGRWVQEEQRRAQALANTHGQMLERQLTRSLSAAYTLRSILRHFGTDIDFPEIAEDLIRSLGGITNLQLAPGGVVGEIHPLPGNERALGHNILRDDARRAEAHLAIETRHLTLAGPFQLIQGGVAVIGRMPVFLPDDDGAEAFWGFASVLIRLEDFLKASGVDALRRAGFDYELWRVNPDSGETEVFVQSGSTPLREAETRLIEVPNGQWTLAVAPRDGWSLGPYWPWQVALSLLVAGLAAVVAYVAGRLPERLQRLVEAQTVELTRAGEKLSLENQIRREAEAAARREHRFMQSVLDSLPEPIRVVAADGTVVAGNRGAEGLPRDQTDAGRVEGLRQLIGDGEAATVMRVTTHPETGEQRFHEVTLSPVHGAAGTGLEGVVESWRDVTERVRSEVARRDEEQRLQYLAHHDALTGLPNRTLLRDRLAQAVLGARRRGGRFALLFIDLDGFKPVNDTYGHELGDEVLRRVAKRLRGCVRELDTVARVGGDEFVVLLEDIGGRDDAALVADKILGRLGQGYQLSGLTLGLGASLGVALYPEHGADGDALLRTADLAMYRAKAAGGGYRYPESDAAEVAEASHSV